MADVWAACVRRVDRLHGPVRRQPPDWADDLNSLELLLMEHLRAEDIVTLNDPELRQGLIREDARMHRAELAAGTRPSFGSWLALTVRGLTSRTRATRTLDSTTMRRRWSLHAPR